MRSARLLVASLVAVVGVCWILARGNEPDTAVPQPTDDARGPDDAPTLIAPDPAPAPTVTTAPTPEPAGATAIVEVVVHGPDDTPLALSTHGALLVRRFGAARWEMPPQKYRVVDGKAYIPKVPVGKELRFVVYDPDVHFAGATETEIVEPDGVRTVVVRLGKRRTRFTGLVVDEANEVIAGASLVAIQSTEVRLEHTQMHQRIETDEHGRFEVLQRVPSQHEDVWLVLRKKAGEIDLVAKQRLPKDAPAEVDLGVITLRPSGTVTFVARGRVVDEHDKPLFRRVSVGAYAKIDNRPVSISREGAKVQRDGTFEIHSGRSDLPDRIRVVAGAAGRVADAAEVAPGTEDIVLRLVPGATLRGSCAIPDGIPAGRIVVAIREHGSPLRAREGVYFGKFSRDGLRAGRYDLTVQIKSTPWTLAAVKDIVVPAGGEAADPRLESIDIAGTVRAMHVRILRPDGEPLGLSNIGAHAPDGTRGNFGVRPDGRAVIVAPVRYDTFTLRHREGTATVTFSVEEQVARLKKPPPDDGN